MAPTRPFELEKVELKLGRLARLKRNFAERVVELFLFLAATSSVLVTFGIITILVVESIPFFSQVSIWDFVTGTVWTPLFANPQFGILPLLMGTFLTTVIALLLAIPVGTLIAILMNESSSALIPISSSII